MAKSEAHIDEPAAILETEDRQPAILVVDDSLINREVLRINLRPHGYECLFAANGDEAIQVLSGSQPVDLILLDLIMPVMDGFSFLDWRKTDLEAAKIPVIVNSSLYDFESIASAMNNGAYDYFTKPLSKEILQVVLPLKIKNAISSQKMMAAIRRQNEILTQEIKMAARYQQFLLPQNTQVPEAEVAFLFQPCSAIGGDYFDFINLPNGNVALFMADVSGHGLTSAMTATMVKALLPGYLQKAGSPSAVLYSLNHDLLRLTQDDAFVTAFAAFFDPARATLTWASAGHPPPVYLPLVSPPQRLASTTPFLGIFGNQDPILEFEDKELLMKKGDAVAFYTDGLIDAPSPDGKRFKLSRLEKFLFKHSSQPPQKVCDLLWDQLKDYTQGYFPDDVAFIMLEI